MKPKLLCILHRSPPMHGAAKVGDFISDSKELQEKFECKFLTIKSSESIREIGKFNVKKLYYITELYLKVLYMLVIFKPDKVYYTASIHGLAFYRDLIISSLWKAYAKIVNVDIYYHYHTKGVSEFVASSKIKTILTNFFVRNVNIILLSPLLKDDWKNITTYKRFLFLPNGVEDPFTENQFDAYIEKKYDKEPDTVHVLYLAHMIIEKGYKEVLFLAKNYKNSNFHFHFAGSFKDEDLKKDFFSYIKNYGLNDIVTYHGFIEKNEKKILLKKAHILLYPSKNDAFPLTILEALSYGVPVLATEEGSIKYILDESCGEIIKEVSSLPNLFHMKKDSLVNRQVAKCSRFRYLSNFTLKNFEKTLLEIFSA